MSDSIDIQALPDFLRWLDTARQLGMETLMAAGFTEEQISQPETFDWLVQGVTVSGNDMPRPITITSQLQSARRLLQLVDRITKRVTGEEEVDRFQLVLDGVLIADFRSEIYAAVWRKEDHAHSQRRIAKSRRSLTAALADRLRGQHNWRSRLPKRENASEGIGNLRVRMESDGRYTIEDTATGKKSRPVTLESIARIIRM